MRPLQNDPNRVGWVRLDIAGDRCRTPFYFVRWPCAVCGQLCEKDFQGFPVDIQEVLNRGKWLCLKCIQRELPF